MPSAFDLGPASHLSTLKPAQRKQYNEKMAQSTDLPPSANQYEPAPLSSSIFRSLAASRSSSFYGKSQGEESSFFNGEQTWQGRSQLIHVSAEDEMRGRDSCEGPLPWAQLSRVDRLNVDLEQHPHWVAHGQAGPGTYYETKNRLNLIVPRNTGWDGHFIVAHELDGNPVKSGMRRLSPARRRHNGGVGFDRPNE